MKKIQTQYGYFAIIMAFIIVLLGMSAILISTNNSEKVTNKIEMADTTLMTFSNNSNEKLNNVSFSWDELGQIFEEAEPKIANMTDIDADDYLREKIQEYLNTKAELINSGISMLDIYDIYDDLTDAEKALIIQHPIKAKKVNECRKLATNRTEIYYNDNSKFTQDSADAFRHGYWNALMAIEIGEEYAAMFADAHEDRPESFGVDKDMDLMNNDTGRKDGIAHSSYDTNSLADLIMNRVSFGYYKKIVDGELVASDFQNLKGVFAFDTYNKSDGTVGISRPLINANETYTIPKSIDGKIVSEIGANSFKGMEISGLQFDKYSEVKSIGVNAFKSCSNLGYVIFPSSLEKLDGFAFYDCGAIIVSYPENSKLHTIGGYAFGETSFSTKPLFPPSVTFIGVGAFVLIEKNDFVNSIVIPSTLTKIEIGAFNGYKATFYAEATSRPSSWSSSWNNTNRPVVWGCNLSADKKYVESVNKTLTSIINANAENGISAPYRSGYNFDGWYTTADFSGTQYMDITAAPNGLLYAKWTDSCVAEGTMITLADGSQKAVEELTGNEMLLVWNLKTGSFDSAPILFIDHDDSRMFEVINLSFSDGTTVKIISEHAFWDFDLNQYVFLRNDAFKYIGHWFNKQANDADGNLTWNKVKLIGVEVKQEYTSAWSPVTANHLCYYVNGMLSMPGATTGLINLFAVNPDTLKIDEVAYLADIETYGLFTYEEFKKIVYISEDVFNAFNGQYLKIAIGKGLITIDELIGLISRYAL